MQRQSLFGSVIVCATVAFVVGVVVYSSRSSQNATVAPAPTTPAAQPAAPEKQAAPVAKTPDPGKKYAERPTDPALIPAYWEERSKDRDWVLQLPERWKEEYAADPDYYTHVDAARLFAHKAEDAQTLPPIEWLVPTHAPQAAPDSWVAFDLVVKAAPNVPVTFYAPELGELPNGKHSITVKADDKGIARTRFKTGVTLGAYTIHAGSPHNYTDFQLPLVVHVVEPEAYQKWLSRWQPEIDRFSQKTLAALNK